MNKTPAYLLALCCLTAITVCNADTVRLRNGQTITGSIETEGDKLHITTPDGKRVTVNRAEVDEIRADDSAAAKSFSVPDELRRRVENYERLKELGSVLRAGGNDAVQAARALAEAGPEAVEHLASALREKDGRVVGLAVRALGTVGGRFSADAISAALPDMPAELQVTALGQLGTIRYIRSIPPITALLSQKDTPQNVRRAAVTALGMLSNDFVLPPLIRALSEAETSSLAADAIATLDSPCAVAYLAPILSRRLPGVRGAAAVIRRIARPEHAPLVASMKKHVDPAVRDAAISAWNRLREDRVGRVACCIALLRGGERGDRADAAEELARLTGDKEKDAAGWLSWWHTQNAERSRIAVLAVGKVDAAAARLLAQRIELAVNVKVLAPTALAVPRDARIPGSDRLDADALMDQMERWLRDNPHVIAAVGLTEAHIELAGSGQVMGAPRYGRCGLISLPALEAGNDAKLAAARLSKYGLHILARIMRIARADSDTCPASAVFEASDIDALAEGFSEKTRNLLAKSIAASICTLAGDFDGAIRETGQLSEVADARQRAIETAKLAERRLDLELARRWWTDAIKLSDDSTEKSLITARIELIESLSDKKQKED